MFYMVGDTSNDIDAAKAANIKSIAVAGGYTDKDVNNLGATHTLKNMKDIIKLLGLS
jgi:phosphoglycolate phosphatase